MIDANVGAMLVSVRGRITGIVTERDYLRRVTLERRDDRETAVREIMSSPLIVVTPETTIEECMSLMTEQRIRHLPVAEHGADRGRRLDRRCRQAPVEGAERPDPVSDRVHQRSLGLRCDAVRHRRRRDHMKIVLILTALSVVLAGTTAAGATGIVMCKGSQLTGSFAAVAGSAGAGNISYRLRLKNVSKTSCSVTGLPQGRLLGRLRWAAPDEHPRSVSRCAQRDPRHAAPGPVDAGDRTLLAGRPGHR